jgi:hypothetical protein
MVMVARLFDAVPRPLFMFPNGMLLHHVVVVSIPSSERVLRLISQPSTPAYHTPLDDVQQKCYDLSVHFHFDRQNALAYGDTTLGLVWRCRTADEDHSNQRSPASLASQPRNFAVRKENPSWP